ncbi:hypothetical protein E4U21_006440 [Claviceps maximensis]|nr:hypothetical protein E4U21_006440 [Claviceps maximensis]
MSSVIIGDKRNITQASGFSVVPYYPEAVIRLTDKARSPSSVDSVDSADSVDPVDPVDSAGPLDP